MKPFYFSFLLCFHEKVTNVYYNGRPIGVISNGKFAVAEVIQRGVKRGVRLSDLLDPCPFENVEELKNAVIDAIQSIQLAPEPNIHEKNEHSS